MDAISVDLLTLAAFALACSMNKQAVIPLVCHCVLWLIFLSPLNELYFALTAATIYAAAASLFIRLDRNIRYAMLCISCLYYLNAIDYFLFDGFETLYYHSISYLIGAVDLYVLWQLVKGEPQHVGYVGAMRNRLLHL